MQNQEMINEILDSYKVDNEKVANHIKSELASVRAGRANPHILDKIVVDYYGSPTPINQMANISVPEARMIVISVWDQSQLKNISKAIVAADLGIMPSDDGRVIRLVFPMLTEEKRRELVKQVKKICEDGKVALRNNRRDTLDLFKQMKKDSEISEDDYADLEDEVQKIIDGACRLMDELASKKEKEVMEI